MSTVLYVGTRDGVVTVADKDGAWAIEGHALKGWAVHDVETVQGKPGRVYAGTRGDGVWRSDDYGEKWSKPSYGKEAPGKVRCVTADPDDPDTLYAGTEPIGLWKSTDAGESWAEIESVRNFPHVGDRHLSRFWRGAPPARRHHRPARPQDDLRRAAGGLHAEEHGRRRVVAAVG